MTFVSVPAKSSIDSVAKSCSGCKEIRQPDAFGKDIRTRDGHMCCDVWAYVTIVEGALPEFKVVLED